MNLLLMAQAAVGLEIFRWLGQNHPNDLTLVVTVEEDEIFHEARRLGIQCCALSSVPDVVAHAQSRGLMFDLGLLAWWPKLIRQPLIDLPKYGFVNTHPSLLPYNRGKHYNFWALVESAPFGVSLHFVDRGIDSGDVIAQHEIPYNWEDTGETLYFKAQAAMVRLFKIAYPQIRELQIDRRPQDPNLGSFHLGKEIDVKSEIALDQSTTARELLNLLRARTFDGHPSCRFADGGDQYEVQVKIRKVTR